MKGTVHRIAKNTASLMVADTISKGLLFLLVILIARNLGDVAFGKYSFAFAFTSIFAIFADFGLSTLTIREIARNHDLAGKYLGNISLIKLILSIVTGLIIVISINLLDYPPETTIAIYFLGAYVIVSSFSQFFRAFFRAFERMEHEAFVRIIERALLFTVAASMLHLGYGLIPVVAVFFGVSIFGFILTIGVLLKHFTKPEYDIDFKFWREIISEALPFGLTSIFVVIYFKIDSIMLSMMVGDAAVGWYNAAYNIVDGLMFVIAGSFTGALYPLMSRHFNSSETSLKKLFIKSFAILSLVGFVVSVGVTVYSDKIIYILYGPQYINSVIALKILVWAFFIICISTLSSTFLNSTGKQKLVTIVTSLGAILNVSLNLILIPLYGLEGAAFATVITELFGFLVYFYFVVKILNLNMKDFHF